MEGLINYLGMGCCRDSYWIGDMEDHFYGLGTGKKQSMTAMNTV